jgi:hypothetical protein
MWPESSEEREVCGQGRRHRRDAALEEQALFAEGIEDGGGVAEVAIAAEMVRAQGVYRDEDYVWLPGDGSKLGVWLLAADEGGWREEEESQELRHGSHYV